MQPARLLLGEVVAGHLASSVAPFWGLGRPLGLQERLWLTIEWADGQRDDDIEDYPPWALLPRLREGWLDWDDEPHAGQYQVEWVQGDERTTLYTRLRPQQPRRG